MDECAHTFERDAIVEWLGQHSYCPISRKPLAVEDLVPNHNLADRIEKWKWQNGHSNEESLQQSIEIGTATSRSTSSNEMAMDGIQRSDIESGGRKSSRRLLGRKEYQVVDQSLVLLPQERRALELAENQTVQEQSLATKRKFWIGVKTCFSIVSAAAAVLTILWFFQVSRKGER